MTSRQNAPGLDFEAIANELYSVPPPEFTALRDEHAKAAKERGDRAVAQQISALRKPSVSAWLTNQLVRAQPDAIDALLELGGALREAQASLRGDELRALSQERRQFVNGLVRQARQLAIAQDRPMSEQTARDVELTLEAALTDDHAEAQLRAARLTTPLTPSAEFGTARPHLHLVRETPVAKTPSPTTPLTKTGAGRRQPTRPDAAAARKRRAQLELVLRKIEADAAAAERDAKARNAERTVLDQKAQALETRAAELSTQIEGLTRELTGVHESSVHVRKEQLRARQAELDAERSARAAQRAADTANAEADADTDRAD
jgi:hypothetical protein